MTNTPTMHTFPAFIQRQVTRRSASGITATAAARTTFAADVDREADHEASADRSSRRPGAPEAAIAIRSEASAVQRATRPARRAERRANRAARNQGERNRYEERVRQTLTSSRTRARVAVAEDHDLRSAATGYLTAWLPAIGVGALALAMAVNDPGFVYTTLRQVFDVPASVGIFDVTDPNVVVAMAAAGATTATLLTAAHLVGKALGTLLFSGPLRNDEYPEVTRTWDSIGPGRMILKILIGGAVLAWFIRFLHTIAVARFEQDVTAVFGGADQISSSVVWFITLLPIFVTAFQVVASSPQLTHARKAARWSFLLRISERRHIRRDQRLLKRERAAHRRALLAILVLTDILKDVGRRALAEIVEAALAGERVDLSTLTHNLTGPPTSSSTVIESDEAESGWLPVDLSGTTANAYLPGLPVVSNTVAHAINSFTALGEVPGHAPLAADWRNLRNDPEAFQPHPVKETGIKQTSAQTAGAAQHHTELHRVTPAVEDNAATTESAA